MTFDERQLSEIRANEAWLAEFSSPRPDGALVERVKAAARAEADGLLLAESATPAPAAEQVASVKAAIRAELASSGRESVGRGSVESGRFAVYRMAGAFAAAAVIALAVGVVRLAPVEPEGGEMMAALDPDEVFAETTEAVVDEIEPQLLAIEEALRSLEGGGQSGSWRMGGNNDLTSIDEQIDALWTESYESSETS